MASFSYDISADFVKQIEKLGRTDEIMPKMLKAAAPILTKQVKSETAKHKDTGDMNNSVKETKPFKLKGGGGYGVLVRPTGIGSNGMRNMEKLMHMELGTTSQAPIPVLSKAINDAETAVNDALQNAYNLEVLK